MGAPGPVPAVAGRSRCRGLTLLEILVVLMIVGVVSAIAMPEYQKYQFRARAAGVVVESAPIKRAIDEYMTAAGKGQYKPRLANGTDRSIIGCQAPAGVNCGDSGAGPTELVVGADKLLISGGNIRVVAALCEVDCPSYALSYTSDLNATGTAAAVPPPNSSPAGNRPAETTPPAAPPATSTPGGATPAATTPPATPPTATAPTTPSATTPVDEKELKRLEREREQAEREKQRELERLERERERAERERQRELERLEREKTKGKAGVGPWLPFVSNAHAQSAPYQLTNRVLYEFGEAMRPRAHSSDNATCLGATTPCTVTLKF